MSVKHDWYQTDQKVVITVLIKNVNEYNVDIQPNKVHLKADLCELELPLFAEIDPEKSTHKKSAVKIEISLAKKTGIRWNSLTATDKPVLPTAAVPIYSQNWDTVVNDMTEEDGEKVEALFKKIYAGANEDARRAMNKSYMESGGTVLSTNWNEVGSNKVEVKPPDGVEFKKWN